MIRRALVFLVLVAAGFLLLRLFLGETAFTAKTQGGAPPPPAQDRPAGGGIGLQSGQDRGGVTFSVAGAIELQRTREMPLEGGSRLVLPTYRIKAKDSRPRPERDNLVELDGVTVEMFRIVTRPGAEPIAEPSGTLDAASVLIEIERDAQGRPSLQEDRDMDVREATFTSRAAAGVPPMTLVVARARLRSGTSGSTLTTAPDQRFTLTIGGDRPLTLVGAGLAASIPADPTTGPLDIRVLHDPALTMDDGATVLRARGELHFLEQPDHSSTLDLRDDVTMQSTLVGSTPLTARGEHLHGSMRRSRGGAGKQEAQWANLVLTGAPARVDGGQFAVEGDRLDVLPSLSGGARLLTATGQPARLELLGRDGERSQMAAERRIHIVPLGQLHDDVVRAYGFGRGTLGARFGQLVIFEGSTTVDLAQATGRLALTAAAGLRILRGTTPGSPTTLVGLGAVTADIAGDDLHVAGDDGFVLHDAQTAGVREIRLTLGAPRSAPPRFDVRRGSELHVSGTGRCELQQTMREGGTEGRVELRSPAQDAIAVLPTGTLRRIRALDATTDAGGLRSFFAEGDSCELDAALADGTRVTGEATQIRSDDASEFRLEGAPASVVRAGEGKVLGRSIRVRRARRGVSLRAEGDAQLATSIDHTAPAAATADLRADVIVVQPWRAPPAALLWHASFLPPSAAVVFAAAWRTPHVHATGSVTLDMPGSGDHREDTHAEGRELWLAADAGAARGRLTGAPASVRVQQDGQRTIGEASTILFAQQGGRGRLSLLRTGPDSPRLRLTDPDGTRLAGLPTADVRALSISCAGPILVEERSVAFDGPVKVVGEGTPNGSEQRAPGFELSANGMQLARDATGAVVAMTASGDVRVASPRLRGAGETLSLQLRRTLCTFDHPRGDARLTLDDGTSWRGNRIEVDYASYTVRAWYGDFGGGDAR